MAYASVMMPILLFVVIAFRVVFAGHIAPEVCSRGHFQCNDGQCIQRTRECNGRVDCRDGSDEYFCHCYYIKNGFNCTNGLCLDRRRYCDGRNDCGDDSDEYYCSSYPCREAMLRCVKLLSFSFVCIPQNWMCDGTKDCQHGEDELEVNCNRSNDNQSTARNNSVDEMDDVLAAKKSLTQWFLQRRRNGSISDRWGSQLHRTAVALFLADNTLLTPGKPLGNEISYELTIQLLHQRSKKKKMRSQDLALYLNALLVSCINPRDFNGEDLVSELRRRVDKSNYTNPFEILALCNAGDPMTAKDVDRVTAAFNSQHRPFWIDTQAVASMALSCLSTRPHLFVDERTLTDMVRDLMEKQLRNGTVDNVKSTALLVQALLTNQPYFDVDSAIKVLLKSRQADGSFGSLLNAYHILPVLNYASLLNVSDSHCKETSESDESVKKLLYSSENENVTVQYSVWIGTEVELTRTWKLKMNSNNSLYDVIERVRLLDTRHNAEYNVIDNKPFVFALMGLEDDSEMGLYWFMYTRSLLMEEKLRIVEQSPLDVKVQDNQEVILWYRAGDWGKNSNLTSG